MTITVMMSVKDGHTLSSVAPFPVGARRSTNPSGWITRRRLVTGSRHEAIP